MADWRPRRAGPPRAARVEAQSVGLDQREAAAARRRRVRQGGDAARVALDRDHAARAGGEERAGQPAGTGPDLEHGAAAQIAGGTGDPGEQLRVEQEMLAQPLVRPQLKALDDRAQRRQIGQRRAAGSEADLDERLLAQVAQVATGEAVHALALELLRDLVALRARSRGIAAVAHHQQVNARGPCQTAALT